MVGGGAQSLREYLRWAAGQAEDSARVTETVLKTDGAMGAEALIAYEIQLAVYARAITGGVTAKSDAGGKDSDAPTT